MVRALALATTLALLSSSAMAQDILLRATPHLTTGGGGTTAPVDEVPGPGTPPVPETPVAPLAVASPGDVALSTTEEWNLRFVASGGKPAYGYVAVGAPSGITASADGALTGLVDPDVYAGIRMRVTDSAGGSVLSQPITVTVGNPGVLAATPASITGLDVVAPRRFGTPQTIVFSNSGDRPVALPTMTVGAPFEIVANENSARDCGPTLRRVETCEVKVRATAPANGQAGPITSSVGGVQIAGRVIVPTLTVGTATLADATVGTPYSHTFGATRTDIPQSDPLAWSTQSTLPAGLTLVASTGVLSGTPTAATTEAGASFEVVATHADATGRQTFTLKVGREILTGVTQIATGSQHVCVLLDGGAVNCWGSNANRQLGTASPDGKSSPGTTTAIASGAKQIAAGATFSCALMTNGSVDCWGDNGYGQLGTGDNDTKSAPGRKLAFSSGVTQISAGVYHACAVVSGGVSCWGYNADGQIGNGTKNNRNSPSPAVGTGVVQVVAGANHTCARVASSGTVNCWGSNGFGQLGTGNANTVKSTFTSPNAGPFFGQTVNSISSGDNHICARLSNNGVACWGRGAEGQIGDGLTEQRLKPTLVVASGASEISLGYGYTCVRSGGAVDCWGSNARGQLGIGGAGTKHAPGTKTITSGASMLSSGGAFACAGLSDGGMTCWGRGNEGQLGTGDNVSKSAPGTTPVVR